MRKQLRTLKHQNGELTRQLAAKTAAPVSAGRGAAPAAGGSLDWEAQKQRLLAQLDEDFDESGEERAKDRLTVESGRVAEAVVDRAGERMEEACHGLRRRVAARELGGMDEYRAYAMAKSSVAGASTSRTPSAGSLPKS